MLSNCVFIVSLVSRYVPRYLYLLSMGISKMLSQVGIHSLLITLLLASFLVSNFISGIFFAFLEANTTIPDFFLLSSIPFCMLHSSIIWIQFFNCSCV